MKTNLSKVITGRSWREFLESVTQSMAIHNVNIRCGRREIHRNQYTVERFNSTLAERLFGYHYAKELDNPHKRSKEWVKRLPEVIATINSETRKHPSIEIKILKDSPICHTINLSVDIHKTNYYIVLQGITVLIYYLRSPAPHI